MDMQEKLRALSEQLELRAERGWPPEGLPPPLQPDQEAVIRILELARSALFPAHFRRKRPAGGFAVQYDHNSPLEEIYTVLSDQISLALPHHPDYREAEKPVRQARGREASEALLHRRPEIQSSQSPDHR